MTTLYRSEPPEQLLSELSVAEQELLTLYREQALLMLRSENNAKDLAVVESRVGDLRFRYADSCMRRGLKV